MAWKRALAGGAAGTGAALAGLTARYAAGVARADRSWPAQLEPGLRDLGEVGEVSILPLVERLTVGGRGLIGEPGVSYLVRTGATRLLFDSGLSGGRARSALTHNAGVLGVDLGDLDAVVISHLHLDHVGGWRALRQRTFAFSGEPLEPRGVPAHVPTNMQHPRAGVIPTTGARVVAPGIAVLPPLPRMLFLGPVAEQALVVNVRGFGLVLITGCGHPGSSKSSASPSRSSTCPSAPWSGGCTCRSTRPGHRWSRRPCWATRTRRGSPSANAAPPTSSTRSTPVAPGWSRCPATTAPRGPSTRSAAASATATRPREWAKNCE
jgi:7,8-dihydropterin-6-yl-methyl-4-(beta-D-ribofuranosyl)aminobenzene 5'-phosphate synthase